MEPRFKYGDKVLAGNHRATVISVTIKDADYICRIKFDNQFLIPSEMEYEESLLKFFEPHDKICPICGKRWNVVRFNMHVWKDCKKCGKRQEDLIKEAKKENPESDLLREFEKMLGIDGDDFFTF